MRRREDERVRTALRDVPAPGEGQAEERGWAVVREAFEGREPVRQPIGLRARAAIAALVAAAVAVVALTPAGAEVREWIADAIEVGEEDARPGLGSLPAPGAILTESRDGVWILRADGSRRRLGDYRHATWSPNGLFVATSAGRRLFALTTTGEERWSLPAPARISSIDWSSDEGFRVAYVAGRELRVVAGDGQGDAVFRDATGSTAIAWQPESDPALAVHRLAFVDPRGRVTLADTDSGEVLWRSAKVHAEVESLQWSADGERLLVAGDGFGSVLDAGGETALKAVAAGASAATLAPDGNTVAVVRPSEKGGAELALVPAELGPREQVLYPNPPRAAGAFGAPTFSPDGEWILLPWPEADQWLFIRVADRRTIPVDISRQLDPNGAASFPDVAGWCC
jgi:PQQ-like domain/WD40-like Beta Propeller Repeat